jgi:hypothetical protein
MLRIYCIFIFTKNKKCIKYQERTAGKHFDHAESTTSIIIHSQMTVILLLVALNSIKMRARVKERERKQMKISPRPGLDFLDICWHWHLKISFLFFLSTYLSKTLCFMFALVVSGTAM